jgi:hypothetical protein
MYVAYVTNTVVKNEDKTGIYEDNSGRAKHWHLRQVWSWLRNWLAPFSTDSFYIDLRSPFIIQ